MQAQPEHEGKRYDRPAFHVMPVRGWLNDPNGPLFYEGRYHLFFQHIVQGCEWGFGIVWGHSVSSDLVTWELLPHALTPSSGSVDADGCFSGCAVVDGDGRPVILYTGVRLRSNPDCGPLPPPECDLHLPFIESQCSAVCEEGDGSLVRWTKGDLPWLPLPPPDVPLTGWRDPFIVQWQDGDSWQYTLLLGSGLKNQGGTVVLYRSNSLLEGWEFEGFLCTGNGDTGLVWECPILIKLPLKPLPRHLRSIASRNSSRRFLLGAPQRFDEPQSCSQQPAISTANIELPDGKELPETSRSTVHVLADGSSSSENGSSQHRQPITACSTSKARRSLDLILDSKAGDADEVLHANCIGSVAPDPGSSVFPGDESCAWFFTVSPDVPANPCLYWLGRYDGRNFDLASAKGPLRLDLGDIVYAPNTLIDPQGRVLMWVWLQERRRVGSYDYAGCLSVPRMLTLQGNRLFQEPVPEIAELRAGATWHDANITLFADEPIPVQVVGGSYLDLEISFRRGSASVTGLLLKAFERLPGGEGSAALLYHWDRSWLEVVFEGLDPETLRYSFDAPTARHVGGQLDMRAGEPLHLRLLLDFSCMEIYTGTGEVLSTRLYRGSPPASADAGIDIVTYDGTTELLSVKAYEMSSIWRSKAAQPEQQVAEQMELQTALSERVVEMAAMVAVA